MKQDLDPARAGIPSTVASPARAVVGSGRWIGVGLLGLLTLTLGSLTLAWYWPESTLMHFWLVAQGVPALYWLLILWFDRRAPEDGDDV